MRKQFTDPQESNLQAQLFEHELIMEKLESKIHTQQINNGDEDL